MEPVVTLKEHFDDKFTGVEKRLDTIDGKLETLLSRDTDTRVEMARYGGVSALVSAVTATILHYLGRQ